LGCLFFSGHCAPFPSRVPIFLVIFSGELSSRRPTSRLGLRRVPMGRDFSSPFAEAFFLRFPRISSLSFLYSQYFCVLFPLVFPHTTYWQFLGTTDKLLAAVLRYQGISLVFLFLRASFSTGSSCNPFFVFEIPVTVFKLDMAVLHSFRSSPLCRSFFRVADWQTGDIFSSAI